MAARAAVARVLVRDYMSRRVVTISLEETLKLAEDIMSLGHIRHLPVVKGGKLVGVVSQRDLLRASLTSLLKHSKAVRDLFLESVHVSEVMTRKVRTATPDTPIETAARMMLKNKIGCLPVLGEDGEVAGLITETDILRAFVDHYQKGAPARASRQAGGSLTR